MQFYFTLSGCSALSDVLCFLGSDQDCDKVKHTWMGYLVDGG